MSFEQLSSEEVWSGKIARVRVERFRHDDGEEVQREVVGHPGAVAIVAHDGEALYLVRQPREVVGEEDLLELPAGKLDREGEDPLEVARRELTEEIGKTAETWEHLKTFWTSPGFTDEQIHVYMSTGLSDEKSEAEENERIEVERVPLAELDDAIRRCRDGKSLVALLWFRAFVLPR
jgi:ADP-ribose pyrophosphatase